jgi:hypothetical protein
LQVEGVTDVRMALMTASQVVPMPIPAVKARSIFRMSTGSSISLVRLL